ncbi:MAG: amidohydrolase [Gammaproteobacteria bacterium]|nr:amidohydrolase [Gammaproteobacteria bacterium]
MSRFGFSGGGEHAAWLDRVIEPIIDPDRPIIDAHHHLWMRDGSPYLFPELLEDLETGHNVVATVFAECHSMYRSRGPEAMRPVGETEFVAGVAAMSDSGQFGRTRACAAMFGAVDLGLGAAAEPVLAAHVAASGGRFRGIRASTCWHADQKMHRVVSDEGVLVRDASREVFSVLERVRLVLDVWVYHTQLREVMTLADALPDLSIVLDHFGTPILGGPYRGQRDAVFAAWNADICELAKRPNVTIKLGALPIRTADSTADRNLPPTSAEVEAAWRPWFDAAVAAFGCNRAMFESNFPVHKNWCGYSVHWNACKRLSAGFSEYDKDALFRGTAQRVYQINLD